VSPAGNMKLKNLFKMSKKREKANIIKKRAPKAKKKAVGTKKAIHKRQVSKKTRIKESNIEVDRNQCPECGSLNVVISQITGNTICQDCGAILAGLPPDVEKQFANVKQKN
jgi:ribosomal protein S27E